MKRPQSKVGHGSKPEAAVRVNDAVVAPDALGALLGKLGHILVRPRLSVQHRQTLLGPDQDGVLRIPALNVGRDGDGLAKLEGFEGVRAVGERDGVELLLDDVDEAQRVRGGLIERPLTKRAVSLEVGLADVPLLDALAFGHCLDAALLGVLRKKLVGFRGALRGCV